MLGIVVPFLIVGSGTVITCNYVYDQFPAATVQLTLNSDGTPVSPAQYSMDGGSPSPEPVTAATMDVGELAHVWLDDDSPQDAVEMIVYSQPQANGQSVLINHNVPVAQDIWGTCTLSSATAP